MTCRIPGPRRQSITARASAAEKAQFSALAHAAGLSESAFALNVIRSVLHPKADGAQMCPAGHEAATDRLTIRLRPGDGSVVASRGAQRGMKASTYVAALVRSHIVANPPMTDKELAQLKEGLRILETLGLRVAQTGRSPALSAITQEALRKDLQTIRAVLEGLEICVHRLARASLVSWESRSGRNGP